MYFIDILLEKFDNLFYNYIIIDKDKLVFNLFIFIKRGFIMINTDIMKKSKKLRYVEVYNTLFKMIKEEDLPDNYRLPSEPDLAKELGVSRTTLRQALSLLQDDGLIKNIRGKGNFIIRNQKNKKIGLEKLGHIIYKSLEDKIDHVEMDFHIEPPSDYFVEVLGKKTVAAVNIDRWYMSNGNAVAYTYTIIPIETISSFDINLNDTNSLLKFIEKDIYNKCSHSSLDIKFSSSGKFATKRHSISSEKQYHLIEESIYKNTEYPIAFNKHYLPILNTSIKIHTSK